MYDIIGRPELGIRRDLNFPFNILHSDGLQHAGAEDFSLTSLIIPEPPGHISISFHATEEYR